MPLPTDPAYAEMPPSIDAEVAHAQAEADAKKQEQDAEKLVNRWSDRIRQARLHDKSARERYEADRKVARGESNWLVDTNLIGAIIEILAAFIYAKNPDISARPSQAVGQSRLHSYAQVAKTIEVVVSQLLRKAGLKRQAKRWLRSCMTIGVGWMTAGIQTKLGPDPIVEQELNDLETKLKQLQLQQAANERGDIADYDRACAEIENKKLALGARRERAIADGCYIDFRTGEDVVVSPECGELENYTASPWIAYDSYKAKEEGRALLDWPDDEEHAALFKTANLFMQRVRGSDASAANNVPTWVPLPDGVAGNEAQSEEGFVRLIEIWSKRDGLVFTLLDGCKKWGRAPYAPVTSARFYHGFMLGCHYMDGERHPQSDVHQLHKLQEEYNRTRSNFAEHRKRGIPGVLFDKTVVDSKSIDAISTSTQQEYTGVETTNGQPLSSAFFPKPYAQVDQGLYSTDAIRMDMEKVSGAQDAQQGGIAVEKTLGEAEIQQSGFQARTGARRDDLEDVLTELAEHVAQVALQLLDPADAARYAGPEAAWVRLSVEEATTLFDIEIKAGSTGKPQNSLDKQTWGTLLPLLQDMINKIGQARVQGDEWAAKPWIALLRETAQRLDDRIDVDALLPVVPPDKVTPPPTGLSPMDQAKIRKENDQAYQARATGVAALAALGLPPQLGEDPQQGGGLPPELQATLGPMLAKLGAGVGAQPGGPAPGAPMPSPDVPDPSTAALS